MSVVVPTRDRPTELCALLESLSRQEAVDFQWEIVVVDNGPAQAAGLVCGEWARSLTEASLRCVAEPLPGLLSGRHRGTTEARGEVLVFVDDDVTAAPSWLGTIGRRFGDPDVHFTGGPCLPGYELEPPDWMGQFWFAENGGGRWCGQLSVMDLGDAEFVVDPLLVWGLNLAIRKSTLVALRGFHPDGVPWELRRYRGDGETGLSLKAKEAGIVARYLPGAAVEHSVPAGRLTLDYFEKRAHLQGISDSYSAIRAAGGLARVARDPAVTRLRNWAGRRRRSLVSRSRAQATAAARVEAAYKRGYAYHQSEVAGDPGLLSWVLRPDYWDYRMPGVAGS